MTLLTENRSKKPVQMRFASTVSLWYSRFSCDPTLELREIEITWWHLWICPGFASCLIPLSWIFCFLPFQVPFHNVVLQVNIIKHLILQFLSWLNCREMCFRQLLGTSDSPLLQALSQEYSAASDIMHTSSSHPVLPPVPWPWFCISPTTCISWCLL